MACYGDSFTFFYLLLILYFAANPWNCSCDAIYRTYRVLHAQSNITLMCGSPAELSGQSWEVLEDKCRPTSPPPPTTTATAAAATTTTTTTTTTTRAPTDVTALATETPEASYAAAAVITIVIITVLVTALGVAIVAVTKARKPHLDRLWWEDEVARKDLMAA
jgi:hypothetical protein